LLSLAKHILETQQNRLRTKNMSLYRCTKQLPSIIEYFIACRIYYDQLSKHWIKGKWLQNYPWIFLFQNLLDRTALH